MNVVASNSIQLQTQGRTDLAATGPSSDAVSDGADPVTLGKGGVQSFGTILSDVDKGRHPVPSGAPAEGKARDAAADQTKGAADATAASDAQDLRAMLLDGKNDPISKNADDPSKTTKSGHATDDATTDPAGDLSAQLALASQWTPVPVRNDPAADDGKSTDSPAARAKSDARNAKAGAVDIAQVQGAVIPVAFDAAAFGVDRNVRATGSHSSSAVSATAKSDSLKAEGTAQLATTESKTISVDKLFNLVAGNTSTASPDLTSIASQFVTQISAQVSNAQNALAAVSTPAQAALSETVGSPAWSHELGQAALRMATNDLQNASLRLNPEHLGPLDVQMRIDNGVAHMQFAAMHADTRHALESSRATLDQMFSDQGLKLGDWSVGNSSANGSFARSFGAASSQGDGSRPSTNDAGEVDGDTVSATVSTRMTRPLGLVDTFA
jgi:flagellar hook-length control protein FliK